jgi:hypothetical protein
VGKKEQIQYWVNTAEEDWRSVQQLIKGKFYVQALFFTHLVIEKLLLEGRYPDFKKSFHKIASPEFVKTNMALVANRRQCLLEGL